MEVYVGVTPNESGILLDFCNPDRSCNKIVTLLWDAIRPTSLHILKTVTTVGCTSPATTMAVYEFFYPLTGIRLGKKDNRHGIYLVSNREFCGVDKRVASAIQSGDWLDGLARATLVQQYTTSKCAHKKHEDEHLLWIGEEVDHNDPRN